MLNSTALVAICIFPVTAVVAATMSWLIDQRAKAKPANVAITSVGWLVATGIGFGATWLLQPGSNMRMASGVITAFGMWWVITLVLSFPIASFIRRGASPERRIGSVLWPWLVAFSIVLGMTAAPALLRARLFDQQLTCASQLRQIGVAIEMYRDEHGGALPPALTDLGQYLGSLTEILSCPSPQSKGTYEYDPSAGSGSTDVVVWDLPGNHPDGGNVLFGDGKCKWLSEAEFETVIAAR